ncbi:LysO family transporter [Calditerrivibrio sp.]|uniref:LysO family transporter n=1 Tax=Calditerrivibrio sp. TaxID=2792612 RepID=UPI003D12DC5E
MAKYLFFLLIGSALGFATKQIDIKGANKWILNFSVIILLFFMGIGIGKDPDLKIKILNFGFIAFIISSLAVFFSITFVYAIVKLFGKQK